MLDQLAGLIRKFSRDTKIYHKLITSIILMIVIPMLFLSLFFILKFKDIIENEISKSYGQVATQYVENINYKFNVYQNLCDSIAGNNLVQDIFSGQEAEGGFDVYTMSSRLSKEIESLIFNDVSGDVSSIMIYSTNESFPSDGKHISNVRHIREMPWYPEMVQDGHEYYYFPSVSWKEEKLISIVKPIFDLSGRVLRRKLGYIKVDVLADGFFNMIRNDSGGKFNATSILDEYGGAVYSSGTIRQGDIGAVSGAANAAGRDMEAVTWNGVKELLVSKRIDQTGWKVLFYFPYSEIERKVFDIGQFLILIVAAILAFFTTISILFSRSFSSRIMRLVKKIGKVGMGDLEIKDIIEGKDEIGILDSHFNQMVAKLNESIHDNYIAQLEKREAELTALQTQINPHFLYNTLEAVSSMAAEHGVQQICTVCQKLGEMFRYSINISRNEFVMLTDELKHIRNYIVIQKIRFDDQFDVFFDIPEDLLSCMILKFILQPIIENALYHGFDEKRGKGFLEISARRENRNLVLKVQDDGVGMTADQVDRLNKHINDIDQNVIREYKGSIGIRNVNARIKMAYGGEYGITVMSEYHAGTQVILTLPLYGYAEVEFDAQDIDR